MNLQDHAGLELAPGEFAVDGDHGQLDEVGGGALQRRVDGGALGKAALIGVAALDVGDGTDAAEERAHAALAARGFKGLFDEFLDARIAREVAVDVGARLLLRNAQLRGQAEGRDAIDDAEVDGLGAIARLLVHLVERHAEDLAGGEGVDVFVALVSAHQQRVTREVGQKAQFDLGIIGGKQLCAGRGGEGGANLAAQLGADGNVLQIRIDGGEPACRRRRGLERGVHARLGIGQQRQRIDVIRFELGEVAIFEDQAGYFMLLRQIFEHVLRRGDGFALAAAGRGG